MRWKDTKEIKTETGVSREIICTHPVFPPNRRTDDVCDNTSGAFSGGSDAGTHVHKHTRTRVYTYAHTDTHIQSRKDTHTLDCTYACKHTRTNTHGYTHTLFCSTHMHTRSLARMPTQIHTHTLSCK